MAIGSSLRELEGLGQTADSSPGVRGPNFYLRHASHKMFVRDRPRMRDWFAEGPVTITSKTCSQGASSNSVRYLLRLPSSMAPHDISRSVWHQSNGAQTLRLHAYETRCLREPPADIPHLGDIHFLRSQIKLRFIKLGVLFEGRVYRASPIRQDGMVFDGEIRVASGQQRG